MCMPQELQDAACIGPAPDLLTAPDHHPCPDPCAPGPSTSCTYSCTSTSGADVAACRPWEAGSAKRRHMEIMDAMPGVHDQAMAEALWQPSSFGDHVYEPHLQFDTMDQHGVAVAVATLPTRADREDQRKVGAANHPCTGGYGLQGH